MKRSIINLIIPIILGVFAIVGTITPVAYATDVDPVPVSDDADESKKITICHIPPGNPENAHSITINQNALNAHLAHNDTEGACKPDEEKPKPEPILGSITVCKIIAGEENQPTDGAKVSGVSFSIAGLDFDGNGAVETATDVIPTSVFTTPLTLNTDLLGNDSVNDGQCVTYNELAIGSYFYDQETTSNTDGWNTPLYNDQYSKPVSSLADLFFYSDELFTESTSDDATRNFNTDGHIVLTESRPHRTLVVLNIFKKEENQKPVITPIENSKPIIMLDGDNPFFVMQGTTFTDPGATAHDKEDGNLTLQIVNGGNTVATNTIGTYMITYDVHDSQGVAAEQKTREVRVVTGGMCISRISVQDVYGVLIAGNSIFFHPTAHHPNENDWMLADDNKPWKTATIVDIDMTQTPGLTPIPTTPRALVIAGNEIYRHDNLLQRDTNWVVVSANAPWGSSILTNVGITNRTSSTTIDVWSVVSSHNHIYFSSTATDTAYAVDTWTDISDNAPWENAAIDDVDIASQSFAFVLAGGTLYVHKQPYDITKADWEVADPESQTLIRGAQRFDGDFRPGIVSRSTNAFYHKAPWHTPFEWFSISDNKPWGNVIIDDVSVFFFSQEEPWDTPAIVTLVAGDVPYMHIKPENVSVLDWMDISDNAPWFAAGNACSTEPPPPSPPQCSDKKDNDGDNLVDTIDPGCHTDSNANNSNSYNPNDDDENSKPVITLIGSETITIIQGGGFIDPGATANDPEDGDITDDIAVGGSVNAGIPETYTLTYNVTDSARAVADEVTRVVVVNQKTDGGGGGCTSNCGGGGGGGGTTITLEITNEAIRLSEEGNVILTWNTNLQATSQVLYDVTSHGSTTTPPTGGSYLFRTATSTPFVTSHSMTISDLTANTLYYFRPVSARADKYVTGKELRLTPTTTSAIVIPAPATTSTVITRQPCQEYLLNYIKIGEQNDPAEVRKLESFLNVFEGFSLPIDGVYDQRDFEAVGLFQERYFNDILSVWGHTERTGYVYYTTRKKINEIICNRPFPLNTTQLAEVEAFKVLLETLRTQGITPTEAEIDTGAIGLLEDKPSFDQEDSLLANILAEPVDNREPSSQIARLFDAVQNRSRLIGTGLIVFAIVIAGIGFMRARKDTPPDDTSYPPIS